MHKILGPLKLHHSLDFRRAYTNKLGSLEIVSLGFSPSNKLFYDAYIISHLNYVLATMFTSTDNKLSPDKFCSSVCRNWFLAEKMLLMKWEKCKYSHMSHYFNQKSFNAPNCCSCSC